MIKAEPRDEPRTILRPCYSPPGTRTLRRKPAMYCPRNSHDTRWRDMRSSVPTIKVEPGAETAPSFRTVLPCYTRICPACGERFLFGSAMYTCQSRRSPRPALRSTNGDFQTTGEEGTWRSGTVRDYATMRRGHPQGVFGQKEQSPEIKIGDEDEDEDEARGLSMGLVHMLSTVDRCLPSQRDRLVGFRVCGIPSMDIARTRELSTMSRGVGNGTEDWDVGLGD
ncbi:hypothetical protein F5Y17DRAFT_58680 [Xylariaceae sp. FL0594]|nr:hypothetical protein F5Y17DRAFT_58680 [Xylariaceae sp. FL0594]